MLAAERLAEGKHLCRTSWAFSANRRRKNTSKLSFLPKDKCPHAFTILRPLLDLCEVIDADFSQLRPAAEIE